MERIKALGGTDGAAVAACGTARPLADAVYLSSTAASVRSPSHRIVARDIAWPATMYWSPRHVL